MMFGCVCDEVDQRLATHVPPQFGFYLNKHRALTHMKEVCVAQLSHVVVMLNCGKQYHKTCKHNHAHANKCIQVWSPECDHRCVSKYMLLCMCGCCGAGIGRMFVDDAGCGEVIQWWCWCWFACSRDVLSVSGVLDVCVVFMVLES